MTTFRQRRLDEIERSLLDLVQFTHQQLLKCQNCDAYHAADLADEKEAREMADTLDRVREWRTRAE